MNIVHFNIAALSICCFLLLGGYALNRRPAGVAAMLLGMLGLLGVIGFNIYVTLHGWPGTP